MPRRTAVEQCSYPRFGLGGGCGRGLGLGSIVIRQVPYATEALNPRALQHWSTMLHNLPLVLKPEAKQKRPTKVVPESRATPELWWRGRGASSRGPGWQVGRDVVFPRGLVFNERRDKGTLVVLECGV